jgi:hypothetical protein
LFSKDELENFKLILLGYPVDEKSKSFVKEWKKNIGDSLVFYDGFVPNDDFDNALETANVVMGSLNVNYSDRFYKEIYGKTKDTGIEAHAIAYAKPLIINEQYSPDQFLKSSSLTFKDQTECFEHMSTLISNKEKYETLREFALENSQNYSIEKVSSFVKSDLR